MKICNIYTRHQPLSLEMQCIDCVVRAIFFVWLFVDNLMTTLNGVVV